MRRSWASVTVGLLVVIVGVVSYFLIHSTSERSSSGQGYTVWGLFRDASGVFEKSRVQTAGIAIGQIDGRVLDPSGKARITIRLKPGIKIYENAVVAKKSASLLGEFYLEIDPGTEARIVDGVRQPTRVLKEGDQIKDVREPTAMGDIIDEVGTLMPIMHDILEDVHKLTSGRITDIAENVNKLIETNSEVLERLLNRVDHIAASVEGVTTAEAGDVKESLRNVREITESIKGLIGTTKGSVADTTGAVRGTIDRLQTTIASLDRTMQNIEDISARVDKGEGTVGHLVNDDTIARNVEDITDDASTFVHGITHLQTIVGLRTEYNFLSSTFKNYLSVQLMPRPDKFYLIELVDDPRGYRSQQTQVTNSSLTGVNSSTTVTTTEQLRFSLMLGKRVGPVAGRFGIKESTGGFGGDLFLFDDRLTLSVDVFDMRTNQYPRVKPALMGAIWKRNLFVVLGADDVLNTNRARGGAGGGFDWFTGAQLTFNDEDLKSLLLFGGGAAAGAASK
ncbi:MAG TPA: MlaD family protein [Polyangia bacterium]|nr:MlaD family protein [Polyangia bacterium]